MFLKRTQKKKKDSILATSDTYARDPEIAAEIQHVCWLIAHSVASLVLPSAGGPVGPAAILAWVTLNYKWKTSVFGRTIVIP